MVTFSEQFTEVPIGDGGVTLFGLMVWIAMAMKEMYRSVDQVGGEDITATMMKMPGSIVVGFIHYWYLCQLISMLVIIYFFKETIYVQRIPSSNLVSKYI